MGVHDSITINCDLPDPNLPKTHWQTDIDSNMSSYELTKHGRLLHAINPVGFRDNGEAYEIDEIKWIDRNFEGIFHLNNFDSNNKLIYLEVVMVDGAVVRIQEIDIDSDGSATFINGKES